MAVAPMKTIKLLAASLGLLLTACQSSDLHMAKSDEREGGLIGTGRIGIFGTITDLGSIYVNGLRVEIPVDLSIETAWGAEPAEELRTGYSVAAEVVAGRAGYEATRIERYQPVIAPVSGIRPESRTLIALGTMIEVADGTPIYETDGSMSSKALSDIDLGSWIEVSGFWQDRRLEASAIRLVSPRPVVTLRGTLNRDGNDLSIGPVVIEGLRLDHPVPAYTAVSVTGSAMQRGETTVLQASAYAVKPIFGDIDWLLAEGYVSAPDPDRLYTVFGTGLVATAARSGDMADGQRRIYCAKPDSAGIPLWLGQWLQSSGEANRQCMFAP